jgi:hypothetical protein
LSSMLSQKNFIETLPRLALDAASCAIAAGNLEAEAFRAVSYETPFVAPVNVGAQSPLPMLGTPSCPHTMP